MRDGKVGSSTLFKLCKIREVYSQKRKQKRLKMKTKLTKKASKHEKYIKPSKD